MARKPFVPDQIVSDDDLNELVGVYHREASTVDVTNSNAELPLFSHTIEGGDLGSTHSLHLKIIGDCLNNSGAGQYPEFRVKFGATTMFQDQVGDSTNSIYPNGTPRMPFFLDIWLVNLGVSNSQLMTGQFFMPGDFAAPTAGVGDVSGNNLASARNISGTFQGTASEDTSTDKVFAVTWQWDSALTTVSIRSLYAELRLN